MLSGYQNVQLSDSFEILFRPKRYKIFFGGRGGAKTVSFSKALILKASEQKLKVLCLREYMNSIKASVHSSLSREVEELELSRYFDLRETEIRGRNGSLFVYAGIARDPLGIKSYDDFDVCWIEEAESISKRSLGIVIPTLRKKKSEIWFSYNPEDEFGAVHSRFAKPYMSEIRAKGFYEDDKLYVAKVNLSDNPFAPDELIDDSAKMKARNPREWEHVYGGECYADYEYSLIKPEWFDAAINAHSRLGFKVNGVRSTGFDPADTGDDKALAARHGPFVLAAKRWSYGELPEAIDLAFEFVRKHQGDYLVYDDDGLGKSIQVYLHNTAPPIGLTIEAYNGGSSVDDPDEYYNPDSPKPRLNKDLFKNKRAQKYWNLRDRFEAVYNAVEKGIYTDPDKMISLSSDIEDLDVLKSELVKIKRVPANKSMIQIQSKRDAAKEGIKSPNLADAVKMCFSNSAPVPVTEHYELEYTSEF